MASKTEVEGYSVIVFVPVRTNQPDAAYRVGGAPDAEDAHRIARNIADDIKKHVGVDEIAARAVDIEPQISEECEHCGYRWHGTAVDPLYNGGCCAPDEDEHQARVVKATQRTA